MNYQSLFARASRSGPVRAALIGVGQFGLTLLAQSRSIPGLNLSVLCDPDTDRVRTACLGLGWTPDQVAVVDTAPRAIACLAKGTLVITPDHDVVSELPVDVVVEATGDPETGARTASAAIAAGRHVVLVTKETDAVVGPLLARRARSAGVVLAQADGDQPSLTLGLVSWCRALGLDIACAGKASEYDFVLDLETGILTAESCQLAVANPESLWSASGADLRVLVARRAEALAAVPQRTPPDYCELCVIANASGLRPDVAELHAPVARAVELPELMREQALGGLLSGAGRLDVFNCLRRPDEISFAGGVFAVVETPDTATGELFRRKGMPVSADARHLLLYNPTHLLGAEAPLSILVADRLSMSTGSDQVIPVCDVAMAATRDLAVGIRLDERGKRHRVPGVDAALIDYGRIDAGGALPYFMAEGLTLMRPVKAGDYIRLADVSEPKGSLLFKLRREQDAVFSRGSIA